MQSSIPILCGSIAQHPSALGVAMHNAAYRAAGIPYTYVAFGIEDTQEAVLGMRYLGMRGLGVSMPHKLSVMKYIDSIDETAASIGAVNTIVNNDGYLTGYNTDWLGAVRALQEKVDITGTRSVVVGAGGAARSIVYGLVKEQSQVTVYNRTVDRGKEIARDFGARFGGDLADLNSIEDYDILVNATSVGFREPSDSIIPSPVLHEGKVVLDVVFIPPETRLIEDAESHGCITISGVRMLVHQACYQFELYTGKQAPFDVMEEALLEAISHP